MSVEVNEAYPDKENIEIENIDFNGKDKTKKKKKKSKMEEKSERKRLIPFDGLLTGGFFYNTIRLLDRWVFLKRKMVEMKKSVRKYTG